MRCLVRSRVVAWSAAAWMASMSAGAQTPTLSNVAYGPHERQVLDFYQADSSDGGPTPLVFYIHGGAWVTGDKSTPDFLAASLAAGFSVVSIDYRYTTDAPTVADPTAAGYVPPVKASLDDTARALQFVRSQAEAWNIDKWRIGAVGGSAGGFNALWLAFHDDLADPLSSDTVSRESTRLSFAFAFVPQTSLDPVQMREWTPNLDYGQHAFGLPSYQAFLDSRDDLLPWIEEFSPYALASADDPSVYLFYDTVPTLGEAVLGDAVHSANWGAGMIEKLDLVGVEYELNVPGSSVAHPDGFSFIVDGFQNPIPEPGSLSLLTIGGVLLSRGRRRG